MRPAAAIPAAALAAVAVAAVVGGGSSRPAPAARPGPVTVTVAMGDFFYAPRAATARVGQPVRFVNRGAIEHTVADTTAQGRVRSRLVKPRPLGPGASQTVRFGRPGLVRYVCTFHPTLMAGTIRVVA